VNTTSELRAGVVGAGLMGADHVARLTHRVAGAAVSAVIEPDQQRAAAAVQKAPGARAFTRVEDALDAGAVDAVVIATPGQFHEPVRLQVAEHQSFTTRFRQAFDTEVQDWADAARQGRIAGPSAWDGYMVSVASAAGVKALDAGGAVPVELPDKPAFYAGV
jgi:predicted dehydrogenase